MPTRHLPVLAASLMILSSCGSFGVNPHRSLHASVSGTGEAGGIWTDHFRVSARSWRFHLSVDCTEQRRWSVDLTLEQMHANDYNEAVPLDVGWDEQTGPRRAVLERTIHRSGEFWFIMRASPGCTWTLDAPSR